MRDPEDRMVGTGIKVGRRTVMTKALLVASMVVQLSLVGGARSSWQRQEIRCSEVHDDLIHSETTEGGGKPVWSQSVNGIGEQAK